MDLVIALRPEIELCYLGIITKCFEILENRNHGKSRLANHDRHIGPGGIGESDDSSDADSDETDDDHDEEGDGTDSDSGLQPAANDILDDSEDAGSDTGADSAGDTDDDMSRNPKGKKTPRFRLREILFYDDKISIFKARHGRL